MPLRDAQGVFVHKQNVDEQIEKYGQEILTHFVFYRITMILTTV